MASSEITYLDPKTASFARTAGGMVSLKVGRKRYDRVTLRRSFPFSDPDRYVSVGADGGEIAMIADVNLFAGEQRAIIEAELARRYFTPTITSVLSVRDEFGYSYWEVLTDAGPARFTIHAASATVIPVASRDTGAGGQSDAKTGLILIDIDGNRFHLANPESLGGTARKAVEFLL